MHVENGRLSKGMKGASLSIVKSCITLCILKTEV